MKIFIGLGLLIVAGVVLYLMRSKPTTSTGGTGTGSGSPDIVDKNPMTTIVQQPTQIISRPPITVNGVTFTPPPLKVNGGSLINHQTLNSIFNKTN